MYFETSQHDTTTMLDFTGSNIRMDSVAAINREFGSINLEDSLKVILNLQEADHFDSSGLGWLLTIAKHLQKQGIEFMVVSEDETLLHMLRVTQVDRLVKVVPELRQAVNI